MRTVNQTTVNVVVNDRIDRTNVVLTCRVLPQRQRLCLREARLAKTLSKRTAQPGFKASYEALAGSPSWGGHRMSGGPGHRSRS